MTTPPPPPPPPPASGTTQQERTWALASHIGCVVGAWAAMAFLVPLVIMLVKGNESGFVRAHAVESLNFQLSMLIWGIVGGILIFAAGIGLIVLGVLAVVWIVTVILATMRASEGRTYRYPITIRFVS